MKRCVQLAIGLFAIWMARYAVAAQAATAVASQGQTLVATTAGKLTVQVKIRTHELQIGKPSDRRPAIIQSNCTYSKYPCSIVDHLSIDVGGTSLFVPRSAFCDLADLSNAEITVAEDGAVLILHGGDASESYTVKIEFDAKRVKRRVLESAMSPGQPLQETFYHEQVLGD